MTYGVRPYTTYPDLSHYKRGVPLHGANALITKATQGTAYVDPTWASYRAAAKTAHVPCGGFHWVTTDSPAKQARHAFDVMGPDITAMWDVEKGAGTIGHMLDVSDEYRALGGVDRFGYVPRWYWLTLGKPSLAGLGTRGIELVSSAYGYAVQPGAIGWQPYGGMTPKIWQYTDRQLFNGYRVDFNAFLGTAAELAALLDATHKPTTTGDVDMSKLTEIKAGSAGQPVRNAQGLLNAHGAALTIDGRFGDATEKAVKKFQDAQHLTDDGVVGPKTWSALLGV